VEVLCTEFHKEIYKNFRVCMRRAIYCLSQINVHHESLWLKLGIVSCRLIQVTHNKFQQTFRVLNALCKMCVWLKILIFHNIFH
jgi:hypothetical protein